MSKVTERIRVINSEDEALARRGIISPHEVRQLELDALVDTGATMLVLPQEVIERLGLEIRRMIPVRYANGTVEEKGVTGAVTVEVLGRSTELSVLAENRGTTPLIGEVILELLDLLVDPKSGRLIPNPRSPHAPMVDIL